MNVCSRSVDVTRVAVIGLTAAGVSVGCGSGPNPGPAPSLAAESADVTAPLVSPITPPVSPPVPVPRPPLPPLLPPPLPTMHGHFRGTATRGSDVVHAEMLIAADGAFRLYLGAPDPPDGIDHGGNVIPWLLGPTDPMQVRGHVVMLEGERASGAGTLVGENCSLATDRPACAASPAVELELGMVRDIVNGVAGELRVGAPLTATWEIDAAEFNFWYRSGARPGRSYIVVEQLSELGRLEKLQVVVDTADRIFFQSTATGCIGNGTLAPHADGKYLVYDASVLIEGCTERFERLNGAYDGLATSTNDNRWWPFNDSHLLMYLSSSDSASPRALTMYGPEFYAEE